MANVIYVYTRRHSHVADKIRTKASHEYSDLQVASARKSSSHLNRPVIEETCNVYVNSQEILYT